MDQFYHSLYGYTEPLPYFYNHLNLVDSIVYDDARKYEFTYDATGSLLQKRIYLDADTRIEKHDYINGIEYINGDIESIYTPEGRIVNDDYFPDTLYVIDSIHGMQEYAADVVISNGSVKDHPNTTEIEMIGEDAVVMLPGFKVESVSEFIADIQNNSSTGWRAEYTVSDHLGNTRLVYSDLNGDQQILPDEIIQENHYYPFGLKQNGDWQLSKDPIAYGYNGMELLDEFGLDLNMTTYRMLDPSIGRWLQVDPKSEALYSLSPYQSMGNNPISNVDPDGDLFYILPKISFSGGFSIGLEAGVGVPGIASAGIGGSYNFGNGSGSAYLQGTFKGTYAGVGTDGAYAGVGLNAGPFNFGASVSSSGGPSLSAGVGDAFGNGGSLGVGASYGADGLNWSASASYASQFYLKSESRRYLDYVTNPKNAELDIACCGHDVRFAARDRALLNGDITREEYKEQIYYEGIGGIAAASIFAPYLRFGQLSTTAHGATRLAGAATRGGVLSSWGVRATRLFGTRYTQADGATVHVLKTLRGKYNIAITGERGLITTFRNISYKRYQKLSTRYGWTR